MWVLRRILMPMGAVDALLDKLRTAKTNQDFCSSMNQLRSARGAVKLEESGQVAYEMRRRFITRYGSRLKIEVGPFRKERGIFAKAI